MRISNDLRALTTNYSGRLHFKSPVIYNGVCVICVGYINLTKFDGMAKLEFDPTFAQVKIQLFYSERLIIFILV